MKTIHQRSFPEARHLKRAFTLSELLVVIAVIGVLAGILIPVVGSVRDAARKTQCSSNLRQIMLSLLTYASDHRGMLPPPRGAGDQRWVRDPAFTPYLPMQIRGGHNWENLVFVCPAATNDQGQSGLEYLRVTYNATGAMFGPDSKGTLGRSFTTPRLLSSINNLGGTPFLFETKLFNGGNNGGYYTPWANVKSDIGAAPAATIYLQYVHDGAMNIAMADASVRAWTLADLAKMDEATWSGIK